MKITRFELVVLILLFSQKMIFPQGIDTNQNKFIDKFGYRLSLLNLNLFETNIFKNNSASSDFSTNLYPSITLEYSLSKTSIIIGKYRYGFEKYITNTLLNVHSHWIMLSYSNQLNSNTTLGIYDIFEQSGQPDILNLYPLYTFASYIQNREGLWLHYALTERTIFEAEYFLRQRSYTGLYIQGSIYQKDVMHYGIFSLMHTFTPKFSGGVQLGCIINNSNNPAYIYTEPFMIINAVRNIGSGLEIQISNRLSFLNFSSRVVSNDLSSNRMDIINTLMLNVSKNISDHLSVNVKYYYQKDFSNEPYRKFTNNIFSIGLELYFGKASKVYNNITENISDIQNYNRIGVDSSAILTNLGYISLQNSEYEKSLQYSLRALSLNPNIELAHINAGIAYYKLHLLNNAILHWETALKLNPRNEKLKELLRKVKLEKK